VRIPQQSEFTVPKPDYATEKALSNKPLATYVGANTNTQVVIQLPVPAHLLREHEQQQAAHQAQQAARQAAIAAKAREKQQNIEKRTALRRNAAVRGSRATQEMIRELAGGDGPAGAGFSETGTRDINVEEVRCNCG
jgi:hypothetical protein